MCAYWAITWTLYHSGQKKEREKLHARPSTDDHYKILLINTCVRSGVLVSLPVMSNELYLNIFLYGIYFRRFSSRFFRYIVCMAGDQLGMSMAIINHYLTGHFFDRRLFLTWLRSEPYLATVRFSSIFLVAELNRFLCGWYSFGNS